MSQKILVTGGAGFIGSHLCRALLERGYSVRVLDNFSTGHRRNLAGIETDIELIVGDITDDEVLGRAIAGVTYIYHEAAEVSVPRSIEDPLRCHEVNATATARLFEHARVAGVERVVLAASAAAYGSSPVLPKREQDAPDPVSPYASTKLYCEHLCAVYSQSFDLPAVPLRYFNIYGPRQDPKGAYAAVISKFQERMSSGHAPMIFGDGSQTRDFCSVRDVVQANLLALELAPSACGVAINIGTGKSVSLVELVDAFNTVLGTDLTPQFVAPRLGDIPHSRADISRAQALLGYEPSVSLVDGLRELVEYGAA
jgi:UDP-glucose 4-epimerase